MAFDPVRIPDFAKQILQKPVPLSPANSGTTIPKKVKIVKRPDYIFRGAMFGTLSIFMFVGVYFVYNYSLDFLDQKEKASEQRFVFENQLVRGDKSRVISLEAGASRENVRNVLLQALRNEKVQKNEISIITPSYLRDTVLEGERRLVSEPQRGDDFFFTFARLAPLNLRALASEKYALGSAGITNDRETGTRSFFMFTVASAPDANREMLRYETQLYSDMKEIFRLREIVGEYKFKDLSDKNQIMRVGSDDNGVLLVYGFPTPKTILVAPDTETYQLVVSRLK